MDPTQEGGVLSLDRRHPASALRQVQPGHSMGPAPADSSIPQVVSWMSPPELRWAELAPTATGRPQFPCYRGRASNNHLGLPQEPHSVRWKHWAKRWTVARPLGNPAVGNRKTTMERLQKWSPQRPAAADKRTDRLPASEKPSGTVSSARTAANLLRRTPASTQG